MSSHFDVISVPVALIDDPQDPMREKLNEESIFDLLQSIKEVGLLQPITVVRRGSRYEVVAGHRRTAAFRMGAMSSIPARIMDIEESDIDVAKVHENLFREDVNQLDEARFLAILRDKHKQSVAEIARRLKKSEAYVRSRLDLLDYPDYLQQYIKDGKINQSVAYWLNKLSSERVRREYTEYAVRQGINALYAKAWYESYERGALAYDPANQPTPEVGESGASGEPQIPCCVCGAETPLSEHVLAYSHPECLEEIARVRVEHGEVQEGIPPAIK